MNQPKPTSSGPRQLSEIMPEVIDNLEARQEARIALGGLTDAQREFWGKGDHRSQEELQKVQDEMDTANTYLTDRESRD